jgi:phosphonate degradation associated HDIG domain protein
MNGLDELVALYASPAARRMYDEAVSELDHALQTAALAHAEGAPDHLVAAALLHDVGHLVADDNVSLDDELATDFHHERVGARYLARWFGPEVTAPVALHVAAKRYLCAIEPGYLDDLSPSSTRSLALQGGPMSSAEVETFERLPHHEAATLVRRWDDRAKVAGLAVAGLDAYRSLLARLVAPGAPPSVVTERAPRTGDRR